MKTIVNTLYQCEVCNRVYKDAKSAKLCETIEVRKSPFNVYLLNNGDYVYKEFKDDIPEGTEIVSKALSVPVGSTLWRRSCYGSWEALQVHGADTVGHAYIIDHDEIQTGKDYWEESLSSFSGRVYMKNLLTGEFNG